MDAWQKSNECRMVLPRQRGADSGAALRLCFTPLYSDRKSCGQRREKQADKLLRASATRPCRDSGGYRSADLKADVDEEYPA